MRIGPLGVPELLIILVVVLLVFGPRRLPEMAKGIGQSVREFRKGIRDMKNDIDSDDEPKQATPKQATVVESATTPSTQTVSAVTAQPAEPTVKAAPAQSETAQPDTNSETKEEIKA